MITAREIYDKFITGGVVTDAELDYGVRHFEQLEKLAREAGPVFRLMANEAMRVHVELNGFRVARRMKR